MENCNCNCNGNTLPPMMFIEVPYYDSTFEGYDSVKGSLHLEVSFDACLGEIFTAFGTALRAATFSDSTIERWLDEHEVKDYMCL